MAIRERTPMILQLCFSLGAPLWSTEEFVWESSAWRLDFGGSREPCSPDVPFDQVTLYPSVLIIHRQGGDLTRASVTEPQAYLWTIRRLSQDHRHQMLCVTRLPALHRCQLGFLSLPYPPSLLHPPKLSLSFSLQVTVFARCWAACLTEVSQKASSCFSLSVFLIILILTLWNSQAAFVSESICVVIFCTNFIFCHFLSQPHF